MQPGFVPDTTPPAEPAAGPWYAFCGEKLLVGDDGRVPQAAGLDAFGLSPLRVQFLGRQDGRPCFSAELPAGSEPPPGMAFHGLRRLFDTLGEAGFALAGRALQIVAWDRDHQFCGRCGGPLRARPGERAKGCARCGLTQFPRLAPAIIVAVTRGPELLLARSGRHPVGWYSVLAGFVEPGETLEEAVRREVFEEVGVGLRNVRYFGSQPWPFPHSLMVGFTAEYAGGQIVLDDEEIVAAGWFTAETLPRIPGPISIARRLIDHALSLEPARA